MCNLPWKRAGVPSSSAWTESGGTSDARVYLRGVHAKAKFIRVLNMNSKVKFYGHWRWECDKDQLPRYLMDGFHTYYDDGLQYSSFVGSI